ncbi:MAG: hypothetical protein OD918_07095 [Gammaproteobacteria bacterium]
MAFLQDINITAIIVLTGFWICAHVVLRGIKEHGRRERERQKTAAAK